MAGFVFSRCEETRCELHSVETKHKAVRLVRSGMSDYQVADILGVHHGTVGRWARAAGIVRGKGGGCVARNNSRRNAETRQRIESAIGDRFEVVDVGTSRWSTLRCRACGTEFRRKVDPRYPTTCPECHRRETERREIERREREGKRALMQRLVNLLAYEHECPVCGRKFRSSNPSVVYCSSRCRNRHKGYSDHVLRAKMYGVEYDRSITLDKLIERDGLTCYLCGKTCDTSDKRWGSFGPDYPTIDHIVPLSKGGAHTWDNVRVACGKCNCVIKRDEVA